MDLTLKSKLKLIQGDITKIDVDAIVNAANTTLLGGGGVDGAIHRVGGKKILEGCIAVRKTQGECRTGQAVITSGGKLKAKYVIHTVGPVWNGGKRNEEELLKSCYQNSLNLALINNIRTIAFPNISTGVYGFPKELAAKTAINSVIGFLRHNTEIEEVTFVCFDDENFKIYKQILATLASK